MPRGVYPRSPKVRLFPMGVQPNAANPTKKPRRKNKTTTTKTCPTCAETFEAKRKDKRFCCDVHRTYYNQDAIPKVIQEKADAIRAQRTERAQAAKAKREEAKALKAAHMVIQEKARQLHLEEFAAGWDAQIAAEDRPAVKAELVKIRYEGIARIQSDESVNDRYMKAVRGW